MNADTLPMVHPLMIRRITPHYDRMQACFFVGGVLVMDEFDAEEVGMADARLSYDEDVVDCSNRIFQLTTAMMMKPDVRLNLCAFPSRRWRNMREGEDITGMPSPDTPLLYVGNPVRVFVDKGDGLLVVRLPEFLIKSGIELGLLGCICFGRL